jgi:aspartyl-tRNA(Asn)/glutamyl-tRNA(Gln) amidotransferase subunit A
VTGEPADPADLGVVEAAALLSDRRLAASELVQACLARIDSRDGTHSHDGDPASVNAWIRVYEEDALAAGAIADDRRSARAVRRLGPAPTLAGIPLGLKDLFAVAGRPLTASSRILAETPERDCDAWARLSAAGLILLGHLHTHEFAVGGTTDQVGSPWALERSAGGSSGGSAAALAARMTPAATGTDTAGSLRIPSALCGTSTIKPTRGLVSMRGVVPLATSLDHAGPMARSLVDCAALLAAMAGPDAGRASSALAQPPPGKVPAGRRRRRPLDGARLAVSPRLGLVTLDPDVADGFDATLALCRRLGANIVGPPPPEAPLEIAEDYLDVLGAELYAYHRRFDGMRDLYRPSLREWVEEAERRSSSPIVYLAAQERRRVTTAAWAEWLAGERIAAIIEPTVPVVAPLRGDGYEHAGTDIDLISLTHYWDWTGFPALALPAGVGSRSGLPVSVTLIGPAASDWELLALGIDLQAHLGVPVPPAARAARREAVRRDGP